MKSVVSFICILLFHLPILAIAKDAGDLKIISLSPHTTELAFEAGIGEQLIAVSAHSDYPPEVSKLEKVADYQSINIERILLLKPDLILAWQGAHPPHLLQQLEHLGFDVFYSNPHSFEEMANNIELLGKYSTAPEKASARANQIRDKIKSLKSEQQNKIPVRYFYQLWQEPLMTNNGTHWPQPLFSLCGGENIFATSPAAYPTTNIESLLTLNPSAIFYPSIQVNPTAIWQRWTSIPAVKHQLFFGIDGDWLSRPTPRAFAAIDQICAAFNVARTTLHLTKASTHQPSAD